MRLSDGAKRYASVPPPAPVPMTITSKCSTAAIKSSLTVTEAFRSNEPTDQRRETAAVGSGPVEPRRQESVHAEAAAGTRQQEDSREHDHHRVGPAPFVWHVQDADRDVRGHADRYQRPQPRAEPEDQRRSDEGLGDQRHPPKESPVRNHVVDQEVLVGGHGRILDFLLNPVPEPAAGLPAEVVRRNLPARLL